MGQSTVKQCAEAAWTLTGSSEFAVAGESFTLTCNPHDSNDFAVYWKRLDIDTTGTNRASVVANGCKVEKGSDTQYRYTCEPGPVYKLTIPANVMTNSQNNKVWRCESVFGGAAAEYKIKLQVPVSSVYIQADNAAIPQVNVIYDNIPKTFYCITNGCRPKANITVTTTGVTKGQFTESTTQNGDLIITRVSQVITANRGGSTAKTIQCSAVNIQGRQQITSQLLTLDGDSDLTLTCQQSGGYPLSVITWSCEAQTGTTNNDSPIITLDATNIKVQEGDNLNRQCLAIGNPTPTVKWYRGSTELTSYTFISASLVFSNIDRNQADTYQCKATATGKQNFESNPPSVTVALQNTTENATNAEFTCDADGFPTNYTYHGWYQYIGSTLVRSYTDFTGMLSDSNRKITIPRVTFKDTGTYHCVVENGFHGRKPNVFQQGSSYFDVRVSAKFNPDEETSSLGELHKRVIINIKFYSNPPAVISDIKWINETSGNLLTNSDSISLNLLSTPIQRNVYGKTVTLTGQSAILTIATLQSFHLGRYKLQIQNGGNLASSYNFQIIHVEPPEAPNKFTVRQNKTNSVILAWVRGFNGGDPQIFVIRYTDTVTGQTRETKIDDTLRTSIYTTEITGLTSDTTYLFWIYSSNTKGNSSFSYQPMIAKTLKEFESSKCDSTSAAIGGSIGSILTLISSPFLYCTDGKLIEASRMTNQMMTDKVAMSEVKVAMSEVSQYQVIRNTEKAISEDKEAISEVSQYQEIRNTQVAISEVSPNQAIRNTDVASTVHDTDINTYEGLDDTKQESSANTYETLTNKQINEDKMANIYVNTAIGDRINNK
ncbi:hypothetical protein KUTeg_011422 [Tegillarca granosa]|uniref:Nephrin/kirre n=1 Tax=Tegillarca granosa TaxID=220873 RepID=A0ABQ9F399_TEGGR|nr:hypothetical protein KUTeg_011422 [Tegillarca granosa]